jgi:hypothetical protein
LQIKSPYKKASEVRFNKVCGTCPVILLKLKSSKFKLVNFEKSMDTSLSDILQFLKTRVFKDVRLLRKASEEELPFNISPIRKLANWTRLERVAGIGP